MDDNTYFIDDFYQYDYIQKEDRLIIDNIKQYSCKEVEFQYIPTDDLIHFDISHFLDFLKSLCPYLQHVYLEEYKEYIVYSNDRVVSEFDQIGPSDRIQMNTIISQECVDNLENSTLLLDKSRSMTICNKDRYSLCDTRLPMNSHDIYLNTILENITNLPQNIPNDYFSYSLVDHSIISVSLISQENRDTEIYNSHHYYNNIIEQIKSFLLTIVKEEINLHDPVQNITKHEHIHVSCDDDCAKHSADVASSMISWNHFLMSLELEEK